MEERHPIMVVEQVQQHRTEGRYKKHIYDERTVENEALRRPLLAIPKRLYDIHLPMRTLIHRYREPKHKHAHDVRYKRQDI